MRASNKIIFLLATIALTTSCGKKGKINLNPASSSSTEIVQQPVGKNANSLLQEREDAFGQNLPPVFVENIDDKVEFETEQTATFYPSTVSTKLARGQVQFSPLPLADTIPLPMADALPTAEDSTYREMVVDGDKLIISAIDLTINSADDLFSSYSGARAKNIVINAERVTVKGIIYLPGKNITINAQTLNMAQGGAIDISIADPVLEEDAPTVPDVYSVDAPPSPQNYFYDNFFPLRLGLFETQIFPASMLSRNTKRRDGTVGIDGGEIVLNVASIFYHSSSGPFFIAKGGRGGEGELGRNGESGGSVRDIDGNGLIYANSLENPIDPPLKIGDNDQHYFEEGDSQYSIPLPSYGEDAVAGGRPGNGGRGGKITSNVAIDNNHFNLSGGVAGEKTPAYRGGPAGTPRSAKVDLWYSDCAYKVAQGKKLSYFLSMMPPIPYEEEPLKFGDKPAFCYSFTMQNYDNPLCDDSLYNPNRALEDLTPQPPRDYIPPIHPTEPPGIPINPACDPAFVGPNSPVNCGDDMYQDHFFRDRYRDPGHHFRQGKIDEDYIDYGAEFETAVYWGEGIGHELVSNTGGQIDETSFILTLTCKENRPKRLERIFITRNGKDAPEQEGEDGSPGEVVLRGNGERVPWQTLAYAKMLLQMGDDSFLGHNFAQAEEYYRRSIVAMNEAQKDDAEAEEDGFKVAYLNARLQLKKLELGLDYFGHHAGFVPTAQLSSNYQAFIYEVSNALELLQVQREGNLNTLMRLVKRQIDRERRKLSRVDSKINKLLAREREIKRNTKDIKEFFTTFAREGEVETFPQKHRPYFRDAELTLTGNTDEVRLGADLFDQTSQHQNTIDSIRELLHRPLVSSPINLTNMLNWSLNEIGHEYNNWDTVTMDTDGLWSEIRSSEAVVPFLARFNMVAIFMDRIDYQKAVRDLALQWAEGFLRLSRYLILQKEIEQNLERDDFVSSPEATVHQMVKNTLLRYYHQVVRIYQYQQQRSYSGSFPWQEILEQDYAGDKIDFFVSFLGVVLEEAFAPMNTEPAVYYLNLNEEEVARLNRGERIYLDLGKMGIFEEGMEDIRIRDIKLRAELNAIGEEFEEDARTNLRLVHTGRFQIVREGVPYNFSAYDSTAGKKITWQVTGEGVSDSPTIENAFFQEILASRGKPVPTVLIGGIGNVFLELDRREETAQNFELEAVTISVKYQYLKEAIFAGRRNSSPAREASKRL